jgi:raffinose/stachyose/melibiose transport system substrate-binding protein
MKRIVSLLSALLLLSAAFAFANGAKESGAASSASSGGAITLSMYNYNDVTSASGKNFDVVLKAFEQKYPNIKFKIETLFNEPYHQKLQALAVSGDMPDVVYLWPGARTGYVTGRGLIGDLRPYLKGKESDFMSMAVAPQGKNGEIYELPQQVTATHVMYANDTLMKKLGLTFPKTFQELLAQGKKINAAGLVPISMANKDGWQMQSCFLSTLTAREGGMQWMTNAIDQKGASWTDKPFVDALQVVDTLHKDNMFPPGLNQMDYNQGTELFSNDKAVYYIDGGWKVQDLIKLFTPEQQKTISLHTFPSIAGQQGKADTTSAVPGTGYGMSAKLSGEKAKAAWDWIWFYSGPEGSAIHMEQGFIPAYKIDASKFKLDPLNAELVKFLSSRDMTYVMDNKLGAQSMANVLQPDLQKMMFGQLTPTQVAANLQDFIAKNGNK